MRVIAHLSDLHFGTEVPEVVGALEADLKALRPDILALSGDLTQRARKHQFIAAKEFLDRLPMPKVVVPGNHDIPLINLPVRLLDPLRRYRNHFSWDLSPSFVDHEIAVFGFNTVRHRRWKSGHLGSMEVARLRTFLRSVPPHVCKIVVAHHPLIPFPGDVGILPFTQQVTTPSARTSTILNELESGYADLVLAGHLHRGVSGDARAYHTGLSRSIVFAEAGTAISTRRRKELNGYNLVFVSSESIIIQTRHWGGRSFLEGRSKVYLRESSGETMREVLP